MVNDNQIVIPASNSFDSRTARGYISLTLLDDLAVEGNETIELVIESLDAERIMVQNSTQPTLLTIRDNDSKCICGVVYAHRHGKWQATNGRGV